MILMQLPMCELKKPVTLRLEDGETIKLELEQDSTAVGSMDWQHAEGFKDMHFTVGGTVNG